MDMFGKKRGLSDVVTVTLIILLAISAVVIVWVFVRSTLLKVGGQVEGGQCVSIDLTPLSCNSISNNTVIANGPGDTTVTKVKIIYYASAAADAVSETRDGNCILEPLSQKSCAPVDPDGTGPQMAGPDLNGATAGTGIYRVAVAATVGESVCTISESVICT